MFVYKNLTLLHASTVLRTFLDQTSNMDHSSDGNGIMLALNMDHSSDGNGIMFAPMCKADVDGYYTIASNMTYYTAQLFCKISDNPEAWQNVTRKVNHITVQGRVEESWLAQLTQDICLNWDTTYSVNKFQPAKAFDGDKIDATKNRHILRVMFHADVDSKCFTSSNKKYVSITRMQSNWTWLETT
jgi:hypothetical protein